MSIEYLQEKYYLPRALHAERRVVRAFNPLLSSTVSSLVTLYVALQKQRRLTFKISELNSFLNQEVREGWGSCLSGFGRSAVHVLSAAYCRLRETESDPTVHTPGKLQSCTIKARGCSIDQHDAQCLSILVQIQTHKPQPAMCIRTASHIHLPSSFDCFTPARHMYHHDTACHMDGVAWHYHPRGRKIWGLTIQRVTETVTNTLQATAPPAAGQHPRASSHMLPVCAAFAYCMPPHQH